MFYWNQEEYDNACEEDYPDDCPAVIDALKEEHDADYNPAESIEVFPLLLEVAMGDDDRISDLVRVMQADYEASLKLYTDDNYHSSLEEYAKSQSEY